MYAITHHSHVYVCGTHIDLYSSVYALVIDIHTRYIVHIYMYMYSVCHIYVAWSISEASYVFCMIC